MQSGGTARATAFPSSRPDGRRFGRGPAALAGLAILCGGAAPTPVPPPSVPPAPAAEAAKPAVAAAPDTAAQPEANPFATFELVGAIIAITTYRTAYTAVADGLASATTGAIGLVTVAGAATGLIWAGYGPGDENTNYWNLVPAGLGALGGIAVGETVAYGLLGYSPFVAGIAGYVPLTSMTFARYFNGAYAYMTAILGAKAALGLYGVEHPDALHGDIPPPPPAPPPPPPPEVPAPPTVATPAHPAPAGHGA